MNNLTSTLLRNLILPALLLAASLLPAQTPVVLSLDHCLLQARTQSPQAIIARKNFESTAWNYKAFRAGLKPQISLGVNSPGYSRTIIANPQPNGSTLFVPQNQAYTNASLSIQQAIVPTGGTLIFTSGLNRLDVFGTSGYTSWQSIPALIQLQQPILRFNTLRWSLRTEPLRYDVALRRYTEALEDIAIDAAGKYFDLYLAQMRLANEELNLGVNDSIFRISQGRFNVGKIAENDLLQSELAFMNAKVRLENTRLDTRRAEMELRILLGLPDDAAIELLPPGLPPEFALSAETALQQALQNRSDILQLELTRLQAEQSFRQAQLNSRFNATINASYGFNKSADQFSDAYTNVLDRQAVSIGFDIPIMQWGKAKAETRSAAAALESTTAQNDLARRRFSQEVEFKVLEYEQLKMQVIISAKADTIAQQRYDVAKARYLGGKIDITNMQLAQNSKDDSRAAYFQMLRRIWTAYYGLRRATLYDFIEQRQIIAPVGELN